MSDGGRRVTAITEVQRMEGEIITLQDLFTFRLQQITSEGVVIGRLAPTGLRPTFLGKFEKRGVGLAAGIFSEHSTGFAAGLES